MLLSPLNSPFLTTAELKKHPKLLGVCDRSCVCDCACVCVCSDLVHSVDQDIAQLLSRSQLGEMLTVCVCDEEEGRS